jgi:arginyl-tRNA synthetase
MEEILIQTLIDNAPEFLGIEIERNQIQFQKTRKEFKGDLTLVIFPFVKLLRCSPIEAGERIGKLLQSKTDFISGFNVVSGFLNLEISSAYWIHQLKLIDANSRFGLVAENTLPTIMVEYSSPNTNKPLHLGHLRNIFLGYSVAKILKANGYKVVKTQVINDRGIHICKSMLAWERFSPLNERGERETPQNTGLKGDKLVGRYYVEFDKHFNTQAKSIIERWSIQDFSGFDSAVVEEFQRLNAAKQDKDEKALAAIDDKIKELAKNQTEILKAAKDMLVKWEARDPQVYQLWTTMNGWVYAGFEKTYELMGVDFDKLYYESDTFLLGKDVIMDGLKSGVFYQREDGSVWIDLSDEGLDEKLVLRSDGTAVYMTQDIGTAIDRYKDYPDLSGIIYTVGNEQDYHFKVLFLILKKLGYEWAENCFHLSYGMVDLPSGKMKSREGTVVDADDLMGEVISKAKEMTEERGHIEGMTSTDKEALYRMIGLGGLKYYLLKVDPKKRMLFNPEESIELNGNTGPFIQYAHARINSLITKAGDYGSFGDVQVQEIELEIIKQLNEFPSVIKEAGEQYSPALIANYTYELVKTYNTFYQSITILNEADPELKSFRLHLSKNVGKVICEAMDLLGIQVPNRM